MSVKIGIIGAGSANFVLSVVKDICLTQKLGGSTVCFMDVDGRKLATAHELCKRYASELGVRLNIEKTMKRRECLEGADFVIHTALARGGNYGALRAGWKIARALGYRFGGSLHIMHDEAFWVNFHQLQLMESIAEDIVRICPRAWLLLVANPVFAGTTYLCRRFPELNVTGLCHGFSGVFWIAKRLGLEDKSKLTFEVPGVNHFVWMTRMCYEGRDVMPLLDRWIEEKAPTFWRSRQCGTGDEMGPKKVDLYRKLGAYPVGDTSSPLGGGWPHWYYGSEACMRKWKENPSAAWNGYFRYVSTQLESIRRILGRGNESLSKIYGTQPSGEVMVPLIEAMAFDVQRPIVVNIQNRGEFVPGVPNDVAVEIQALCSRRGIQGIRTTGLPRPVLAHIQRDLLAPMEMELSAYESGNRNLLLNLVLMDPWTRSQEQAERLVSRILAMPGQEALRRRFSQGRPQTRQEHIFRRSISR